MIPIEEIVTCADCSRYIRIGYDALEVDQYNIRYGKRVCDTVYNCKDCYKPNKSYHGSNIIFLDTYSRKFPKKLQSKNDFDGSLKNAILVAQPKQK